MEWNGVLYQLLEKLLGKKYHRFKYEEKLKSRITPKSLKIAKICVTEPGTNDFEIIWNEML